MSTFDGTIKIVASATWKDATEDFGEPKDSLSWAGYNKAFLDGTGIGQAKWGYAIDQAVTVAAPFTLDLRDFENSLGEAVVLDELKLLVIVNTASLANGGKIIVGSPESDDPDAWDAPFAEVDDTIDILPQGCLVLVSPAGYVVDATHRNLKIVHSGEGSEASIDVEIILFGS